MPLTPMPYACPGKRCAVHSAPPKPHGVDCLCKPCIRVWQ